VRYSEYYKYVQSTYLFYWSESIIMAKFKLAFSNEGIIIPPDETGDSEGSGSDETPEYWERLTVTSTGGELAGTYIAVEKSGREPDDFTGTIWTLDGGSAENTICIIHNGTQWVFASSKYFDFEYAWPVPATNPNAPWDAMSWSTNGITVQLKTDTPPVITVTTPVAITGIENTAINAVQLQATVSYGGTPTFTHTSGTMPNGLTLSSTGQITGTPTVSGSGSFIVTVSYSNATSKDIAVQWNFEELTISTLSDSIEVTGVCGHVTQPIETGVLATVNNGGTPTYSLNGLPAWMSVSSDGKLQGTPPAPPAGSGSGTGFIIVGYPGAESKIINVTWTVTIAN
jgi:hypothetical protein